MIGAGLQTTLNSVSTATICQVLQRRGFSNMFLTGLKPLQPEVRLVGTARTLRYLPARPDMSEMLGGPNNAQRNAVETIETGEILVIDARNNPNAGTIGDVYTSRIIERGGAGVVTDGCLRDTGAIQALGLPIYFQASHAATLTLEHVPYSVNDSISCAGVFIAPGDVLVGDQEGVIVVPAALAEDVAVESRTLELADQWSLSRVRAGEPTSDVFPISPARRQDFEAWLAERNDV